MLWLAETNRRHNLFQKKYDEESGNRKRTK